jgi:Rad52/22 family double-strand break repair protein
VRITVKARGTTVIREGHGTGEGRGPSPHEVHDIALKAAETDATKRALATFGRPFGLELYRNGKAVTTKSPPLAPSAPSQPHVGAEQPSGFHPDDATPIPRPSRYYGQRSGPSMLETMRRDQHAQASTRTIGADPAATTKTSTLVSPPLAPATGDPNQGRIDKSQLAIGEPKRLRDKAHLKFVASQPCLICGRQPSDPHHLRFAQPRAIGLKVSDEFTVPLCREHHRQLHQAGDEVRWWQNLNIKPLEIAKDLWHQTRRKSLTADVSTLALPNGETKPIVSASRP